MTAPTLLPIYTFARVLGLHPLHVMGVDANIGSAASRVCIHPIQQYSWQDADGVSRDELGWYISEAEQEIADYLGYWPSPTWTADERVEIEQRPGAWYTSLQDIRGDALAVKTEHGYVLSGGRVQKTLVAAAAAVVYTDTDSDGYAETATIAGVATSVTDPAEICLYYPGLSGDDEWEIRPITVTIAAGVATIVCRREQLVKKAILESLDPSGGISGTDAGNFLTTVDVYRKYNDPSVQVQLVWRGTPGWCSCAGDTSCEQCGLTIQNGCMTVKDKKLGLVAVQTGDWNAGTQTFSYASPSVCGRRPDYLRLWYRSGYQDLTQPASAMARMWQIAVAKLAISKLDRLICSCKAVSDVQSHWSTDLRKGRATRGESSTYKVTPYELENCPFGTTVAGLDVWRLCRRHTIGC